MQNKKNVKQWNYKKMIQEIAPFTLKAKVYQFSQFGEKWIFFHKMAIYPLMKTECWMSSLAQKVLCSCLRQTERNVLKLWAGKETPSWQMVNSTWFLKQHFFPLNRSFFTFWNGKTDSTIVLKIIQDTKNMKEGIPFNTENTGCMANKSSRTIN